MSNPVVSVRPSWVEISPSDDFSMQNIPFGVFSVVGSSSPPRCGSAIGRYAVDLSALARAGIFDKIDNLSDARDVFSSSTLNYFMAKPRKVWKAVRETLIELFVQGGVDTRLSGDDTLQSETLIPMQNVVMHLPATVGDYTDFYSSRDHATNVGTMIRGADNALQPNWLRLPVAYHGRSSSIFLSGTDVVRPTGQVQIDGKDPTKGSSHSSCRLLDFELEMSFFVGGPPNPPGTPISMADAEDRIFGFTLMNDWSARDIQKWEYVPLGPFTSKNFATSISPWIITTDALKPYRCPTSAGTQSEPVPLDYLKDPEYSSYDIELEVKIQGESMSKPEVVCRSNFANLYWNAKQQLVHHSVTGCNVMPGDLLGSGTISGSSPDSLGCMLELCWLGTREVKLGDSGQTRKFLKDNDVVIIEGWCKKEDHDRVGFGSCVGKVLAAGSKLVPGPGRGTWVGDS